MLCSELTYPQGGSLLSVSTFQSSLVAVTTLGISIHNRDTSLAYAYCSYTAVCSATMQFDSLYICSSTAIMYIPTNLLIDDFTPELTSVPFSITGNILKIVSSTTALLIATDIGLSKVSLSDFTVQELALTGILYLDSYGTYFAFATATNIYTSTYEASLSLDNCYTPKTVSGDFLPELRPVLDSPVLAGTTVTSLDVTLLDHYFIASGPYIGYKIYQQFGKYKKLVYAVKAKDSEYFPGSRSGLDSFYFGFWDGMCIVKMSRSGQPVFSKKISIIEGSTGAIDYLTDTNYAQTMINNPGELYPLAILTGYGLATPQAYTPVLVCVSRLAELEFQVTMVANMATAGQEASFISWVNPGFYVKVNFITNKVYFYRVSYPDSIAYYTTNLIKVPEDPEPRFIIHAKDSAAYIWSVKETEITLSKFYATPKDEAFGFELEIDTDIAVTFENGTDFFIEVSDLAAGLTLLDGVLYQPLTSIWGLVPIFFTSPTGTELRLYYFDTTSLTMTLHYTLPNLPFTLEHFTYHVTDDTLHIKVAKPGAQDIELYIYERYKLEEQVNYDIKAMALGPRLLIADATGFICSDICGANSTVVIPDLAGSIDYTSITDVDICIEDSNTERISFSSPGLDGVFTYAMDRE